MEPATIAPELSARIDRIAATLRNASEHAPAVLASFVDDTTAAAEVAAFEAALATFTAAVSRGCPGLAFEMGLTHPELV